MSQVIGTVYDGSDRAVKHDVVVPSGVTTAMTAVFVMGTGSSTAVDIDLSSPGVEFTRHVVGNAGKTRVAVFSVVGLAAGDVVTVTLGAAGVDTRPLVRRQLHGRRPFDRRGDALGVGS